MTKKLSINSLEIFKMQTRLAEIKFKQKPLQPRHSRQTLMHFQFRDPDDERFYGKIKIEMDTKTNELFLYFTNPSSFTMERISFKDLEWFNEVLSETIDRYKQSHEDL